MNRIGERLRRSLLALALSLPLGAIAQVSVLVRPGTVVGSLEVRSSTRRNQGYDRSDRRLVYDANGADDCTSCVLNGSRSDLTWAQLRGYLFTVPWRREGCGVRAGGAAPSARLPTRWRAVTVIR